MITWRGIIGVSQRRSGWRMAEVLVVCRFEVYDDAAPEAALASVVHRWVWPLAELADKTLAQLQTLVLDEGLIRVVEIPPYPPVQVGPDPPPLRVVGGEFLQDWLDGRHVLELPLPWTFGP